MLKVIGGEQEGEFKAVASGTLPNGKPVVVNADGTVSVVSGSSVSEEIGSVVQFNPDENAFRSTFVYDTVNDKIILFYIDSESTNNYGAAIVGTVSGTSISFGTPTFFHSTNTGYLAAAFDEGAGKAVVFYANDSDGNKGTAKVATVSGTSISFGAANEFITNQFQWPWASYDSTAGKIVLGYRDNTTGYGRAVVVTTSGTSTSFGTFVTVDTNSSYYFVTAYDSVNNKTLMFYGDSPNNRGVLVVGTVSGTSISFGSINVVSTVLPTNMAITVDPTNNKCVLLYRDSTNSNYGTAKVGTVSGTSVSFGSSIIYSSDNTYQNRIVYDQAAGKVVLIYVVGSTTYGKIRSATVSGTTLTLDTEATFNSATTTWTGAGYDPDQGKVVVAFMANSAGNSFVYQTGYNAVNLTAENYIGMSRGTLKQSSQTESVGTPSVYATTDALQSDLAYDSTSGKMVLAWRDSNSGNGHGKAVVITVSGTTLSYGTPVTFNAASTRIPKVVFDSANNKIVIAYRDDGNNNYSTAIVGTVSGTSISFGTPVVWKSANNSGIGATYDPDNSKVIVGSAGTGAGAYEVFVGTVSGTSISFGSSSGSLGTAYSGELAYDEANNKVIAALHIYPSTGSTFVGTVSGTSISFGSANNITTSGFSDIWGLVYDSNSSNMVMCYQANGLYAIVGEVSGTSMTFGSSVVVQASSNEADIGYDSLINKPIVAFKDVGNSNNGTLKVGTVSGTSISFGSATVYETGDATQNAIAFDSGQRTSVISFSDGDNGNYGTAVGYQAAGSYQVRGEVASGQPAAIDIIGSVNDIQESLTSGEKYYVQTDGTLSTTAGSPSVLAGTAISATKLVVKT